MLKRYRTVLLFLSLAVVVALAVFAPATDGPVVTATRSPAAQGAKGPDGAVAGRDFARDKDKGGRPVLSAMPERVILGNPKVDLFGTQSWVPPPKPVAPQVVAPPPPPPPPPLEYRFAGRLLQDGKMQFFVSRGDTPIPVKTGDSLGGYIVESISNSAIALVYPPLGHKETIPVPPAIPGDAPAIPITGAATQAVSPPNAPPITPPIAPPSAFPQPAASPAMTRTPPQMAAPGIASPPNKGPLPPVKSKP